MRSGRQVPAGLAVALVAALCGVAGVAGVAHGQGARVLGVQFATDPADAAQGPRVVAVTPGSTAQRMGVRVGDRLVKIGRVELVPRPSDPPNAASPTERVRVAMAEVRDLVPVVVLRDGQLLTGVGSWREDFVPVPLNNGDDLMGALLQLSEGMVPVGGAGGGSAPGSGGVPVPSAGGTGSVPSFGSAPVPSAGGAGSVPSFGSVPVPVVGGEGRVPVGGKRPATRPGEGGTPVSGGGDAPSAPDRAWRAACAGLAGTRHTGTYQWLSRSGAAQEQLRFQPDGSYALLRSSAVSSYAEDGCYAISGGSITFYKALSSAMASVPGATSDRRVTLGSASQASFEPRTVSFAREGGGQGGVVIDGERYGVQR